MRMMKLFKWICMLAMAFLCLAMESLAKTEYVAPAATEGISVRNQEYLIGVTSTVVVILAVVAAVVSMTSINYDDDTLLMVEVPEELYQEE